MREQYDLTIIGAGPGGYVAAIRGAQLGMSVALIENRQVGGTCLNRGCIPTKTLLHSAQIYRQAKEFEVLGLTAKEIGFDLGRIYARKEEVLGKLRGGVEGLLKANGVDLLIGQGKITGEREVLIKKDKDSFTVRSEKILIATGSVPTIPPIPGIDLPGVITSDELLREPLDFEHLIIIGGGVIGVEFASLFGALDRRVTIIEAMDRILPTMDREISQNLSMILKRRGAAVYTSAMVEKITGENGLTCVFRDKQGEKSLTADKILVAVGRRANTSGLFAEGMTVETDRGKIIVNESFETGVNGVYAVGDVIGGIQLAHAASAQGIAAVEHMAGKAPSANLRYIPGCVYTDPEIAAVGITADEAKEQGIDAQTAKFAMSGNGKTIIEMQDRSFVKVVFDKNTRVLLGAQLMCARATDLISEFVTALANGLTVDRMALAVRPHPTFSEAVSETLEDAREGAIHSMPRKSSSTVQKTD